jgi:hypothetical protein
VSADSSKDRKRRNDAVRAARKNFGELQEILGQTGAVDPTTLDEQARSYDAAGYRAYLAAREEEEAARRTLDAMMLDAERTIGRLKVTT